jgi:uncharacterized protein (DUF2267 family)
MTRGTLETLGERIPETLVTNLAGQLPHEMGEHLQRTVTMGGAGTGERFDRSTFLTRVAERTDDDEPTATYGARVVLEVLSEAAGENMMDKVRDALPDSLRELVNAGSSGKLGG